MTDSKLLKGLFLCSAAIFAAAPATASDFNVPGGDLKAALHAYIKQAGVPLIVSDDAVKGVRTNGARGDLSPAEALSRILADTGFSMHRHASGAIAVVQDEPAPSPLALPKKTLLRWMRLSQVGMWVLETLPCRLWWAATRWRSKK